MTTGVGWAQAWTRRVPGTRICRATEAGLTPADIGILTAMAVHCGDGFTVEASYQTLGVWTGRDRRNMFRHLQRMAGAGVVRKWRQRTDKGREKAICWELLMPAGVSSDEAEQVSSARPEPPPERSARAVDNAAALSSPRRQGVVTMTTGCRHHDDGVSSPRRTSKVFNKESFKGSSKGPDPADPPTIAAGVMDLLSQLSLDPDPEPLWDTQQDQLEQELAREQEPTFSAVAAAGPWADESW